MKMSSLENKEQQKSKKQYLSRKLKEKRLALVEKLWIETELPRTVFIIISSGRWGAILV